MSKSSPPNLTKQDVKAFVEANGPVDHKRVIQHFDHTAVRKIRLLKSDGEITYNNQYNLITTDNNKHQR